MPNLVGIGLSQVPTNSMLGGLAYQDPEHASIKNLDLKNLSQINSEIDHTATHVFLYDTSKDSDGGAWRYRTQHTSWYNETLGTEYRGTRKEFPAVAVIVSRTGYLDIYDGDDPNLPLWMGWKNNSPMLRGHTNGTAHALNGIIALTNNGTYGGLITIDMVGDGAKSYRTLGSSNNSEGYWKGNIAYRNVPDTNYYSNVTGSNVLSSLAAENTTSVDMAVMPNAPIDPATGLPTPTIVVSTNGGTSMLKPDGTILDFNDGLGSTRPVDFSVIRGNDIVHWNANNGTMQQFFDALNATADSTNDVRYNYSLGGGHATSENFSALLRASNSDGPYRIVAKDSKSIVAGANSGVSMFVDGIDRSFSQNNNSIEDSRVAHITSTYNTGWQYGDIEGAWLCSTDATAAQAVYSDGFSNNDNGWGFVNTSISGGNMVITQQSQARSTDGDALNGIATGTKLVFTFTVSGSGTGDVVFDDDGAGAGVGGNTNYGSFSSTGSYTFTATKTASNRIRIIRNNGSNDYNINFLNITTEYDRSLKDKGLSVYGTVPKNPVATGAELVGYGPFSTTNYLKQQYLADLAPGTGEYSVMCWVKTGTSNADQYIFDRSADGAPRNLLLIRANSGGTANHLQFYHANASSVQSDLIATDSDVTDNNWHQVVGLYDGSAYKLYVDGRESAVTNTTVRDVNNTDSPPLWIGIRHSETSPMLGRLALFRYSRSAPTADQVRDMYEQEKPLFYENSQVTLYGSSSDVKAIAYDEKTELIHIGTASGRSDFHGLARINNTTTAVTTAISAHDGFIIEQ